MFRFLNKILKVYRPNTWKKLLS